MLHCPQCGLETETFHEGYCQECCAENQRCLDEHNMSYDRWQRLSNEERDEEVRRAIG